MKIPATIILAGLVLAVAYLVAATTIVERVVAVMLVVWFAALAGLFIVVSRS